MQVYAWRPGGRASSSPAPPRANAWFGKAEFERRIRETLRAKVPDYMIPAAIVPLEDLPLTANGKVDRKALSQREPASPRRKAPTLPRSEIERRLRAIWEELLGMVDIGVDEGFFELGGNSLLAVRAADRIAKEFQCPYTVVQFLDHAKIRTVADHLLARQAPAPASDSAEKAAPAAVPGHPVNRIEAIEAALGRQPSIQRCAVVERNDGQGEESLVAFAIPNLDFFRARRAAQGARDRLDQWVSVWEKNYQPTLADEASSTQRVNAIGYVRSDSGEPIPEAELREGIDLVVQQVMAHQPKTILEIGCGTGMLLFQFAERVDRYLATDLSRNALDHIRASLKSNPRADRVSLFHCDASRLDEVPVETAEVVVINSVAQYFPGIDYLTSLLESLARRLPPKARIYIGDVRDLRLLRAFHVWTLLHQCPPTTPRSRFRRLLNDRVRLEKELVIHPAYFRRLARKLPRVREARVEPKRGVYPNEFTRFRYDVWLWLDEAGPEGPAPTVRAWSPREGTLDLGSRGPEIAGAEGLYLTDIPNRRLEREMAVLDWLGRDDGDPPLSQALTALAGKAPAGLDPAVCLAWASEAGRNARLYWEHDTEDGRFELYVQPASQPSGRLPARLERSFESRPSVAHSNHPTLMLDWEEHVPALRQALQDELPGLPVPARLLPVLELPMRADGQIDRDALAGKKPKPREAERTPSPVPAPANELDRALAVIGISCVFPRGGGPRPILGQSAPGQRERPVLLRVGTPSAGSARGTDPGPPIRADADGDRGRRPIRRGVLQPLAETGRQHGPPGAPAAHARLARGGGCRLRARIDPRDGGVHLRLEQLLPSHPRTSRIRAAGRGRA